MAPGSYAGTEFLGMTYYYLRDFGESARLRQAALDKATQRCRAYAEYPDVSKLAVSREIERG